MNITNRLFAYPVLSVDKNDYKKSVFITEYHHSNQSVESLKLTFDISMDCPELETLIMNGFAEYVIHLECSTTAYRQVLSSISKHIEYTIPISRLNGQLDAVAFLILKKNIVDFKCRDWEDDYSGMRFNLSSGTILAYQNLQSLEITKDYEEFSNADSIFSVYKKVTDIDKPSEIDLDSAKIRIGLGSKDYDVYSLYSKQIEMQPLLHSMLVLPVLVYVFEELRQDGGEEMYHNKEWFIALENSYYKRGISFMDEIQNTEKTSYQLAQEAMELPLSKAFDNMPLIYNTSGEDI